MKKRTVPCLTGEHFGNWTVGEELPPDKNGRHIHYWCTCKCGNKCKVDYYHLKGGFSTGCKGCIKKVVCKKGHNTETCGRAEDYKCKLCTVEGHIRRTYGITLEEYVALFSYQLGKCAICGRLLLVNGAFAIAPPTEGEPTRAEVDHRHVTKKTKPQPDKKTLVRGLLCGGRYAGCNAKLGHVDNVEWLSNAVSYLKDPPAQRLFSVLEKNKRK